MDFQVTRGIVMQAAHLMVSQAPTGQHKCWLTRTGKTENTLDCGVIVVQCAFSLQTSPDLK